MAGGNVEPWEEQTTYSVILGNISSLEFHCLLLKIRRWNSLYSSNLVILSYSFLIHRGWNTEQFPRRGNSGLENCWSAYSGALWICDCPKEDFFLGCFFTPVSVGHLCLILVEVIDNDSYRVRINRMVFETLLCAFAPVVRSQKMQRSRLCNQHIIQIMILCSPHFLLTSPNAPDW